MKRFISIILMSLMVMTLMAQHDTSLMKAYYEASGTAMNTLFVKITTNGGPKIVSYKDPQTSVWYQTNLTLKKLSPYHKFSNTYNYFAYHPILGNVFLFYDDGGSESADIPQFSSFKAIDPAKHSSAEGNAGKKNSFHSPIQSRLDQLEEELRRYDDNRANTPATQTAYRHLPSSNWEVLYIKTLGTGNNVRIVEYFDELSGRWIQTEIPCSMISKDSPLIEEFSHKAHSNLLNDIYFKYQ